MSIIVLLVILLYYHSEYYYCVHDKAPTTGRPPKLAAAGRETRQSLRQIGTLAAPGKVRAELEVQREAAPEPTGRPNIVIKSNVATQSIFETAGSLNEAIEVVSHMLQRAEMRPIVEHLGYSRAATACDSKLVDAIAAFIKDHLPAGGGSRTTERRAAHSLLGTAAASQQLVDERKITEAANRLGMRVATFRHLIGERLKRDAELEDGVEVGALLKVSRLRRRDACDDEAELFEDWSHHPEVCR